MAVMMGLGQCRSPLAAILEVKDLKFKESISKVWG
jgi:hypothetical protein